MNAIRLAAALVAVLASSACSGHQNFGSERVSRDHTMLVGVGVGPVDGAGGAAAVPVEFVVANGVTGARRVLQAVLSPTNESMHVLRFVTCYGYVEASEVKVVPNSGVVTGATPAELCTGDEVRVKSSVEDGRLVVRGLVSAREIRDVVSVDSAGARLDVPYTNSGQVAFERVVETGGTEFSLELPMTADKPFEQAELGAVR